MTVRRFSVSPAAQKEYRVLGGGAPMGAHSTARQALDQAKASRRPASIHVTKRGDGWAVKTAGGERASTVKTTKAAALSTAKAAAAKRGAHVVEHSRDGKITRVTKPRQR